MKFKPLFNSSCHQLDSTAIKDFLSKKISCLENPCYQQGLGQNNILLGIHLRFKKLKGMNFSEFYIKVPLDGHFKMSCSIT